MGCAIVPFLFRLRRSLQETDRFVARKVRPSMAQIIGSLRRNWRVVLVGTLMVTMTTVSFYMITAYTPTFGSSELHLAAIDSLLVTLCVGASNLFWLPIIGSLSDRVGRRPLLFGCTILMLVSAYPAMSWLVHDVSVLEVARGGVVAVLHLRQLQRRHGGVYDRDHADRGAHLRFCPGVQPTARRLHAGDRPLPFIHATNNRAIPGLWLSAAALLG